LYEILKTSIKVIPDTSNGKLIFQSGPFYFLPTIKNKDTIIKTLPSASVNSMLVGVEGRTNDASGSAGHQISFFNCADKNVYYNDNNKPPIIEGDWKTFFVETLKNNIPTIKSDLFTLHEFKDNTALIKDITFITIKKKSLSTIVQQMFPKDKITNRNILHTYNRSVILNNITKKIFYCYYINSTEQIMKLLYGIIRTNFGSDGTVELPDQTKEDLELEKELEQYDSDDVDLGDTTYEYDEDQDDDADALIAQTEREIQATKSSTSLSKAEIDSCFAFLIPDNKALYDTLTA
jgi:hypothetical protein